MPQRGGRILRRVRYNHHPGADIGLETEHLLIRDHVEGDLHPFFALVSDRNVMRYLPEIYCDALEGVQEKLRENIAEAGSIQRTKFYLAINERETGEFVGAIGIMMESQHVENGRGNLGYFIHEKFWGKGYATEAAKAVLDFAFATIGLHKIVSSCLHENAASEAVMKKCGMIKEGDLLQQSWHEGQWKDRVLYRMLKSEWANGI